MVVSFIAGFAARMQAIARDPALEKHEPNNLKLRHQLIMAGNIPCIQLFYEHSVSLVFYSIPARYYHLRETTITTC